MKSFLNISFLLLLLWTTTIAAHSQTGSTINAASCSQSDVQTALNSVTSNTAVVTIPSGTCHWTGQLVTIVPSVNTNLTIQGSTTVNCTGTPGTSGYSCTPTDNTIIVDDYTSSASIWVINMSSNSSCPLSCYFRMTGFTMEVGAGTAKDNGEITFNGPSDNFRLDHYHWNGGGGVIMGRLFGEFRGVLDHFYCENGGQCIIFSNNNDDSIGYGDGSWTAPTNFGSSDFMFMEDFVMSGGLLEDCDTGGRFVARYGNVLNPTTVYSAVLHTHGTKTPAGRGRGCRAYEAYHLYFQGPAAPLYAAMSSAGGPSLVWNINLASGYQNMAGVEAPRNDQEETETSTPNGWGYCGTSPNGNGVGSQWDGNNNAGTGWPCLDGVGRGQGTQALNGVDFPGALNSSTGTIAWPHEMLEPVYYFNNTFPNANEMLVLDASTQLNRDLYIDNASFNGTTGTGSGPASSKPSSCTAGPGGTYATSPTGSYGVAYWETDNQQLDICTATNTWKNGAYKPYTYPHPLESGSTNTNSSPQPPTNLNGTVVQ